MTRVLVVDNHELVREGLKALLACDAKFEVVGVARDGRQAVSMTQQLNPDMVLMDVRMPYQDGISACREIKQSVPDTRVVMLSIYDDDKDVFASIEAGASGFIIKDLSFNDLLKALDVVKNGNSFFHPIIAKKMADKIRSASGQAKERFKLQASLTRREIDILEMVGKGFNNQEIADKLYLSEGTVRCHVSSVLRKLGRRNRTELALYASNQGLA